MITCVVEYVIDPAKIDAFERFARRWMELVEVHGGRHHGYFLPAEADTYPVTWEVAPDGTGAERGNPVSNNRLPSLAPAGEGRVRGQAARPPLKAKFTQQSAHPGLAPAGPGRPGW